MKITAKYLLTVGCHVYSALLSHFGNIAIYGCWHCNGRHPSITSRNLRPFSGHRYCAELIYCVFYSRFPWTFPLFALPFYLYLSSCYARMRGYVSVKLRSVTFFWLWHANSEGNITHSCRFTSLYAHMSVCKCVTPRRVTRRFVRIVLVIYYFDFLCIQIHFFLIL